MRLEQPVRLDRIDLRPQDAQPLRDAVNVRVHREHRLAEREEQHARRRLRADAGDREQVIPRRRRVGALQELQRVRVALLPDEPHPKHHVLAVAHAGWRGSVMSIAIKTIELMRQHHKILPQDLLIFFGPSAKSCCYTVGKEFVEHLEPFDYKDKLLTKREGKIFFDNPLLNKLQLIDLGISPSQIDTSHNHCTICNLRFHSYRRTAQKESYKVQPTLAWFTT